MLAKRLHPSVLLIGYSIVGGLSRYITVWNKYFKPYKALNCGILETEPNTFCGGQRIYLFSICYVCCGYCGTNNLDHDEPKTTADGIIKSGKVFQEKLAADLKIILTGLLPRQLKKSKWRNKILKVNNYLKKPCKDETNIYYLEQDRNWVHKDQSLDTS